MSPTGDAYTFDSIPSRAYMPVSRFTAGIVRSRLDFMPCSWPAEPLSIARPPCLQQLCTSCFPSVLFTTCCVKISPCISGRWSASRVRARVLRCPTDSFGFPGRPVLPAIHYSDGQLAASVQILVLRGREGEEGFWPPRPITSRPAQSGGGAIAPARPLP